MANAPGDPDFPDDGYKAFGIFEGGGAKGIAHIGALKVAEEIGVRFVGVAGASAGAIMAAFIAAGASSTQLYHRSVGDDPEEDGGIFSRSLEELVDPFDRWELFRDAKNAFADDSGAGLLADANRAWTVARVLPSLVPLLWSKGLFTTREFERWLEDHMVELLERKLPGAKIPRPLTFRHMKELGCIPLKVVATDFAESRLRRFDAESTPDVPVRDAVGASASIPFAFRPHPVDYRLVNPNGGEERRKIDFCDGGVLSNFPAWLFDEERQEFGPQVPTLGFRLDAPDPVEAAAPAAPGPSSLIGYLAAMAPTHLIGYVGSLASTLINGEQRLETRGIENLFVMPLKVSAGTVDFDLDAAGRRKLFDEGMASARRGLSDQLAPKNPQVMTRWLDRQSERMVEAILAADPTIGRKQLGIRANIILPTERGMLRLRYKSNMNDRKDTDDRLELPLRGGASGLCLHPLTIDGQERRPWMLCCDLERAAETFERVLSMDKYQQALIRKDRKSLICTRIPLCRRLSDDSRELRFREPVGVVNFDFSMDIMKVVIGHEQVRAVAYEIAKETAVKMGIGEEGRVWGQRKRNFVKLEHPVGLTFYDLEMLPEGERIIVGADVVEQIRSHEDH